MGISCQSGRAINVATEKRLPECLGATVARWPWSMPATSRPWAMACSFRLCANTWAGIVEAFQARLKYGPRCSRRLTPEMSRAYWLRSLGRGMAGHNYLCKP
jgi:hypothetical protein